MKIELNGTQYCTLIGVLGLAINDKGLMATPGAVDELRDVTELLINESLAQGLEPADSDVVIPEMVLILTLGCKERKPHEQEAA